MSSLPKAESRRERKKAERLSAIYETALELFAERGFNNVTVETITETLDISKGTFFNYFATKEDILLEYHRRIYEEMHEFAEQLQGDSGVELFHKYFHKLGRLIQRDGQRYRMLHLVTSVRGELRNQGKDRYDRVFKHYERFISIAVEAGEIPQDTDIGLLAEFIRDVWQGNLHAWVMQRRPKSLDVSMKKKLDFLFNLLSLRTS